MATEKGIVTRTDLGTAWVKTLQSEACEGCSSCGTCGAQRPDSEVEVINEVGARVGDRILIDFKTSAFLKVTFMLYIFPLLRPTGICRFLHLRIYHPRGRPENGHPQELPPPDHQSAAARGDLYASQPVRGLIHIWIGTVALIGLGPTGSRGIFGGVLSMRRNTTGPLPLDQ